MNFINAWAVRGAMGAAMIVSGWAMAQVPVTGGAADLASLEGTDTLVTVVMSGTEAEDPNCRVVDVTEDYLAVISTDGNRNVYLYDTVKEVRVQDGAVEHEGFQLADDRALTENEEAIFAQAVERAAQIFDRALSNQLLRIRAAAIMALAGDEEGLNYLQQRAEANDLLTSGMANLYLHAIDMGEPNLETVQRAFSAGDPRVRAVAMIIAGMLSASEFEERLLSNVKSRLTQTSAPAALALGKLRSEAAVPDLLNMITSIDAVKAERALEALVQIGGPEVVQGLKERLPNAQGMGRYRIIEALFRLDDPLGEKLLKDEALETPALSLRASMALAAGGELEARERLQEELNERYEPLPAQMMERGRIAATLIKSGDRRNIAVLQELLSSDDDEVKIFALNQIAQLGQRNFLDLLAPAMQSPNDVVAITACETVVAIVNPAYRKRIMAISEGLV